jgi:(p)ppGpp synthase/HD superfamily hydrolase
MAEKYTLQDCIDLATFAHRHQRDKAGEPYINHPLRVLESVKAMGAQAYVQMGAVLHDVTEDTPFTCDMLLTLGVPEAAVNIVRLVDRDASKKLYWETNVGYGDEPLAEGFADRVSGFYYEQIRKNPGALIVKKADIGDNLQPWRLDYLPPETQTRLRKKYAKALELLA